MKHKLHTATITNETTRRGAWLFIWVLLMRWSVVQQAASSSSSEGCGLLTEGEGLFGARTSTEGQVTAPDGRNRTFVVYVPPSYRPEQPLPLLFFLHGGFGSGKQAQRTYGMDETADKHGFIVVYPDGWSVAGIRTWNGGKCCNPSARLNVDDVGFIRVLLEHLQDNLCLDVGSIFATGMSNGAIMSYRLACQLSDRITAAALVAGAFELEEEEEEECVASHTTPSVMIVHGTAEKNIPFFGGESCNTGYNFSSVPHAVNVMAEANECQCRYGDSKCTDKYLEDDDRCVSFGPCGEEDEKDVVLCTLVGGGHTWPGVEGSGLAGEECNDSVVEDFDVNELIWAFFEAAAAKKGDDEDDGASSSSGNAVRSVSLELLL